MTSELERLHVSAEALIALAVLLGIGLLLAIVAMGFAAKRGQAVMADARKALNTPPLPYAPFVSSDGFRFRAFCNRCPYWTPETGSHADAVTILAAHDYYDHAGDR